MRGGRMHRYVMATQEVCVRRTSELQRRDVREVPSYTIQRRAGISLLLHVEVLVVDVVDARQQPPEVDDSLTELRVIGRANPRDVLDVEEPIPGSVPPQI